jgi:1-acyl-sn-glycerol-3-phosphate acyltransferase
MARSLLFNVLFYVTTTLFVVIGSPLLFAPRRWAMAALAVHGRFELWLLKTIVGTRLEVRGQDKVPEGPCLVASKHQSAWETFALIPLFRDPALLMKRELFWIPFHGWFSKKFEMIPVDREKGPAALRAMLRETKKRVAEGTGDHHLPGRHTAATGSASRLQDRSRSALRGSWHPLRAGCAQLRAVLAAAKSS